MGTLLFPPDNRIFKTLISSGGWQNSHKSEHKTEQGIGFENAWVRTPNIENSSDAFMVFGSGFAISLRVARQYGRSLMGAGAAQADHLAVYYVFGYAAVAVGIFLLVWRKP